MQTAIATDGGAWLPVSVAADRAGVTVPDMMRLYESGATPACYVIARREWMIRAEDLDAWLHQHP